ncbi:putative glucan endo-1,3-alpha-glucosidase agn1 precursor [Talaromyces proteolyticus]|uniref:glucan endo-1,3-alpha-glucosidase n=1 Tax=Talaromyces proteolyticus TaxID=1131652 RepID=A0AAD4PYK4_9EURO|nr:putative glucan endo-1,3-alpha-glucosidase agn1 precursor [Talaromyces proteolyticus]KAH8694166.1 putative glucan endo-1,3-alpha-glucosidase agn1 precursor [Talaromyces proteolyticus]
MHLKDLFEAAAILACALPTTASVLAQSSKRQAESKYVFAHFMVGIVQNYTIDDWKADMNLAKDTGIDAFALNCASVDSYTPTQLALAYQAAEAVDFKVFISFDFAYWSNGDTANITQYMQTYAGHPAQMQYNNAAIVSTFVGDSFDWTPVKAGTNHSLWALPNLQDPAESSSNTQRGADGAFSWYAWPTDGGNSIIEGPMTTRWDDMFVSDLKTQSYMAPVSPWFFTHFNSKNWVFICENLPTLRWEEILSLKPSLVEIITWNDYGESHYIGPYSAAHSDDGSSQWAKGFPHDALRDLFKPYIKAYKAGESTPTIDTEELVYWYRPTPKDVTCTNDTLAAPNGRDLLTDTVFVATMLKDKATLTITSGSNAPVSVDVGAGIVTTNVTMGLGTQSFSVSRNNKTILSGAGGLKITDSCEKYNYNIYVGSATA